MGFMKRLVEAIGSGSDPSCPRCGSTLDGEEMIEGSYWCESCPGLVITDGDELAYVRPDDPRIQPQEDRDPCISCQASLSGGTSYMPYEDGSNSHAYIVCPSCGTENIREGFGED